MHVLSSPALASGSENVSTLDVICHSAELLLDAQSTAHRLPTTNHSTETQGSHLLHERLRLVAAGFEPSAFITRLALQWKWKEVTRNALLLRLI